MGKIKVSSCETDGMVIEGLHVIEPTVFNDERILHGDIQPERF